jgi:hypothetical protein
MLAVLLDYGRMLMLLWKFMVKSMDLQLLRND